MIWPVVVRGMMIVHTIDNKLHFISDGIESFTIHSLFPDEKDCHDVPQADPYSESAGLLVPYDAACMKGKDVVTYHINNKNSGVIQFSYDNFSESAINKTRRIDSIYVSRNGQIVFKDHKILLKDLYFQPVLLEGIYFSAYKKHVPRMIKNIFILTSRISIKIIDIKEGHEKIIEYHYLTYLFESFENFSIEDNKITIKDKTWDLSDRIVAVFEIVEKDGINYMMRLFNDGFVDFMMLLMRKDQHIFLLSLL